MKLTFMDKVDRTLTKLYLMNPLTQFDRFLHRHNLEHIHQNIDGYKGIIRTRLPKKEKGAE